MRGDADRNPEPRARGSRGAPPCDDAVAEVSSVSSGRSTESRSVALACIASRASSESKSAIARRAGTSLEELPASHCRGEPFHRRCCAAAGVEPGPRGRNGVSVARPGPLTAREQRALGGRRPLDPHLQCIGDRLEGTVGGVEVS